MLFQHEANVFAVTCLLAIRTFPYYLYPVFVSEVGPYLRGSGARQRVVLEGNRLVLTCLVGGSWPLQYRWTLNNSNVTDWTPQYRSVLTHSWRISAPFISPQQSVTPLLIAIWKALHLKFVSSRFFLLCWSWHFWIRSRELLTKLPRCQSLGAPEPIRDLFGSHFFLPPLSELSGSSERRCEGGSSCRLLMTVLIYIVAGW